MCQVGTHVLQYEPCTRVRTTVRTCTMAYLVGKLVGVVSIEDITGNYHGTRTVPPRQRSLQRGSLSQSSPACGPARAPAPASPPSDGLSGHPRLRVPRVVVLAGHMFAWLGAVRVSSQSTGRVILAGKYLHIYTILANTLMLDYSEAHMLAKIVVEMWRSRCRHRYGHTELEPQVYHMVP
jgi:hypothetical protein